MEGGGWILMKTDGNHFGILIFPQQVFTRWRRLLSELLGARTLSLTTSLIFRNPISRLCFGIMTIANFCALRIFKQHEGILQTHENFVGQNKILQIPDLLYLSNILGSEWIFSLAKTNSFLLSCSVIRINFCKLCVCQIFLCRQWPRNFQKFCLSEAFNLKNTLLQKAIGVWYKVIPYLMKV